MIIIACIIWGLTFPAIKISLDYIPPIILGALRYLIGAIPIMAFLAYRQELKDSFNFFRNNWKYIVSVGIFMVTIPNITQNIGMLYTTASVSSIIQSSGPIITIILAVMLLQEKLTKYRILGTGLALVASVLLIFESGITIKEASIIGNVLIFNSAVSYGINGAISKAALKTHTPLILVGYSMLIGALILFPLSFAFESQGWVYNQNYFSISLLLALAFFPCFFGTLVWFIALKSLPLSKQVVYVYLIPIVAVIFSIIFLNEILTLATVILGALTILGVAIAQYGGNKKIAQEKK
jgi:drug/metabolite transporter (DMT)-like permease